MSETKTCRYCSSVFVRRANCGLLEWSTQIFCSRLCSSRSRKPVTLAFRRCTKCRMEKPNTTEYFLPRDKGGSISSICRPCERLRNLVRSRDKDWAKAKYEKQKVRNIALYGTAINPKMRAGKIRYRKKHPERHRAHVLVQQSIARGKLNRLPCEVCGANAQAHHDDYSRPLDVRWLCRFHHYEHHRQEIHRRI